MEDASGTKMINNYRNLQPRNGRNIIKVSNSDSYSNSVSSVQVSLFGLIVMFLVHFY